MAAPASFFGQSTRRPPGDAALRARDERVESLKAVVGKLAHDFNNFLVPQFGYLTLIAEELPAESSAAQYLKTAEGAARTTAGYIENILLAVRPQRQYSPKDFDLAALIADSLESWKTANASHAPVELSAALAPAPFHGDERHWGKVIEHLLSNARYALATGGKLTVSLAPEELDPAEAARLGIETLSVYRLEVGDTGFGIPEAFLGRVFEPFVTSRNQARGSGLGLTIVHTVAHFHAGQVELRSTEDRGSTVTLWIPRTPPATARGAGGGLLRQRPAKKKKVLLVEDDPLIVEVFRAWLAAHEFEAQAVPSPADAAKFLTRDPAAFSLVITETVLKGGRGEDVFELTRKIDGLACIFLAGSELPKIEQGGGGEPLVIRKPVSFNALLEVIRAHIRA